MKSTSHIKLLGTLWMLIALVVLNSVFTSTYAQTTGLIEPSATLSADGWDNRFGTPGIYEASIVASTVSATGDLYVAGTFNDSDSSVPANQIARWDGQRWWPLDSGITSTSGIARVRALASYHNLIYAVGDFDRAGGMVANQVARWDGTNWAALGNGTGPRIVDNSSSQVGAIYTVATAPNGNIYVAGNFTHIDNVLVNGVARWDGSNWSALGVGLGDQIISGNDELFPAWVYTLAVAANGDLYAGGVFTDAGSVSARNIARWDGSNWSALSTGVTGGGFLNTGRVESIAVNGSDVYVGGLFTTAGGNPVHNLAMWDGSTWHDVGGGVISDIEDPAPVLSLMIQNGALYVGGTFTQAGQVAVKAIARWDGTNWATLGAVFGASGREIVYTLSAAKSGGVYAGGDIDQVGTQYIYGIAHWNGNEWGSLGQGVALSGDISGQVNAVAIDAIGRVYIGGFIQSVGGIPVHNIAMWDGAKWYDVGGGVAEGPNGTIYALLAVGNDIYVGGDFITAGTTSANHVAKWDGKTWSALDTGINGTVYALAAHNGTVYAGGSFSIAGSQKALDVAVWNGTRWNALGGTIEIFEVLDTGNEAGTFVRALDVDPNTGELFIGGHFQTVHDSTKSTQDSSSYTVVHNLVSYLPETQNWFLLGNASAPGVTSNGYSGFGTTVYALKVANKDLFVGGTFNRAGIASVTSLAQYDRNNGSWSSPSTLTSSGDVSVKAIATLGNQLVIGGTFTALNGNATRSVAVYNFSSKSWDVFGSGLAWKNGVPRANAIALAGNSIWFGGEFSQAGPHPSLGVAHYSIPKQHYPPRAYIPQLSNTR